MRNHHFNVLALVLGSLFIVACPSSHDANTDASSDAASVTSTDGPLKLDLTPALDLSTASPDAALACCPTGFDLYDCQIPDGGTGLACHNPAMGCASSQTCGQGCDPQVSGRCACVQTELCIQGDHFDSTLCKCVPSEDAGTVPDAKPTCVDNVLCIQGDHFDTTLCKCIPNEDAGTVQPADTKPTCIDNVLCIQGDHFDTNLCKCVPDTSSSICSSATDCTGALPALCQLCADGGSGCAHFTCAAGQCQVAYCP